MFITIKTDKALVSADISDIVFKVTTDKLVEVYYKNTNYGNLLSIIGTTEDELLQYLVSHENSVVFE